MATRSTEVTWSVHLDAPPERVYDFLATDEGRARFWAEAAVETDGKIRFEFPSGETYNAEIIATDTPERFVIDYFGNRASFVLREDGNDGTILTLTHHDIDETDRCELMTGWVSVLLALKAAVNYAIDLRNHDPRYTWANNYVGN